MDKKASSDLLTLGMDLSVYIFGRLVKEGVNVTPVSLIALGNNAAQNIEKATGMPAEDLALSVQPAIDAMIEKMKE